MRVLVLALVYLYLNCTSQPVHGPALRFLRRMAGKGDCTFNSYLVKKWKWSCNPARVNLLPKTFWPVQLKKAERALGCHLCPVCVSGHGNQPYGAYAIVAISDRAEFFKITENETIWSLGDEQSTLNDLCRIEWTALPSDEMELCDLELPVTLPRNIFSQLAGTGKSLVARCIYLSVTLADVWRPLLLLAFGAYLYVVVVRQLK